MDSIFKWPAIKIIILYYTSVYKKVGELDRLVMNTTKLIWLILSKINISSTNKIIYILCILNLDYYYLFICKVCTFSLPNRIQNFIKNRQYVLLNIHVCRTMFLYYYYGNQNKIYSTSISNGFSWSSPCKLINIFN